MTTLDHDEPPHGITLAQARAELMMEGRHKTFGVLCPCCGKRNKVYHHAMHASMAAWLVLLVKNYEQEPRWYGTAEPWALRINRGTGDAAKLRHWGLIHKKPLDESDGDKASSGLWKPTVLGSEFVRRRMRVMSHWIDWHGESQGMAGEPIMIDNALGKKFRYSDLWGTP